jgi:hypothetical protein
VHYWKGNTNSNLKQKGTISRIIKGGLHNFVLTLVLIIFLYAPSLFSQKVETGTPTLTFGGYVNWTAVYDSRQTINLREGQFLLYPSNKDLDVFGNDANAKSNFNMLSVQSRINVKLEGLEILGAKSKGFVEAEFFGTSDGDANGLRLRHAYWELKWAHTSLLAGQTWHPMFIAEAFPQVVSFNTGVPFQPFSRNPQIRFVESIGKINLIAVLYSQRDFTSNGPSGYSSSYLKNSSFPAAHLQVQLKMESILLGSGINYQKLMPRLKTNKNITTEETVESLAGIGYFKFSNQSFGFAAEGVYGQNLADLLMLGGYAVSGEDAATQNENYTNIKSYSLWADVWYGKELQLGVFAGYAKNLGSNESIVGKIYSRGDNIGEVLRVSPRIQYTTGKIRVGLELELTQSLYGKTDNFGKINSGDRINNSRLLLGTFYNF